MKKLLVAFLVGALIALIIGLGVVNRVGATTRPVPPTLELWHGIHYRTWGNIAVGDCLYAAAADLEQTWSMAPSLASVLQDYRTYGPNITAAFAAWKSGGIGGYRVSNVIQVTLGKTSTEATVARYHGAYAVVEVRNEPEDGTPWTYPQAGAWQGHAVAVVGYSPQFVYLATWTYVQPVTWSWFLHYTTDLYGVRRASV